jgi:general secretion pathway protein J
MKRRIPKGRRGQRGFTLVEVLIAVSILVGLTAMMWAAINSIFNAREYFEARYERFQIVRNSMGRMTNELSAAYMAGPQHGGEEIPGQERDPTQLTEEEVQAAFANDPIQFGFKGSDERVDFTAFAHVRKQDREPTSQHAEISYFMRRERDDATGRFVTQLVRREDPSPDDKLDSGGTIYVMIPEIEEIEFEYWDAGEVRVGTLEEVAEGRWIQEWDTTRRDFAGRLPTRVKIKVTLPPQNERSEPEIFTTQVQLATTEVLEF